MLDYIILGMLAIVAFFVIILPVLSTLKNDNKDDWAFHLCIREHIKEKNDIRNDLIYILSELCRREKCCIKGKANIINGHLTGIDNGFFLYYPLENGEIIRFILPLKYWDIFLLNISYVDKDSICRTVDLREERYGNK